MNRKKKNHSKKLAHYQGDITQQKEAQKLVKREIKLATMQCKEKVQDELLTWRGIKSMVGIQDKKKRVSNTDKA